MKLSLETTKQANGWTIEYRLDDDHTSLPSRTLRHIGEAGKGFPLPPEQESVHWKGRPDENLCGAQDAAILETHFKKVIHGEPQAGDVRAFGSYLTSVLFGQNWEEACKKAGQNEGIEIELRFSPEDIELQRLPWEMMYDDQVPFAASPTRGVAIARIVKQKNPQTDKISLNLPLKVLFVIGSKLDNALRPGAEYLGLLRQMKIQLGHETRNRSLNVRIITQATIEEIEASVNDFNPTVVHFICHGDDEGRLLLAKYNEQKTGKTDKADLCDATRLLEILRQREAPHSVPPIIVLNACHTSEISESGKESYSSLAAQLVAGGVAVAIGMRGEVADGVCRVFTRRFYQTLVTRNPINIKANESPININISTAHGRRAAMLHFVSNYEADYYENHVEWARPTLFLRDNLALELVNDETACVLAESSQKFIIDNSTFCDRLSYLQHYQEFRNDIVSNRSGKMLLFSINVPDNNVEQYGKTRLLRELAIQVLLDGLIPCAIFSDSQFEPPDSLLSFAFKIVDAMNETREMFGLQKRSDSFVLTLVASYFNEILPDVTQKIEFGVKKDKLIKACAESQDSPAPETVRMAMLEDFKTLQKDLAELNLNAPIVVLLDDLHKYEGVTAGLLNSNFFKDKGLGDADTTISVIATYSTAGEQSSARKDIEDFIKAVNGRVHARKAIELQPITELTEARMAYALHFISKEEPLAVSTRSDKQGSVNNFFDVLHKSVIKGIPSLFNDRMVGTMLEFAVADNLLLKADDEQIYENLGNGVNTL
jgi:hypothetical protein